MDTAASRRKERIRLRLAEGTGEPWFLAGALVVAGVLRVGHVLALRRLPLFDQLVVDSAVYDAWAQRIADGDWLGQGVFYQDPLYPYALAVLYRVFGHDLLLVRLVQAALGVGTCALVAAIGRRVGGRAAGGLAALLLALFGPAVFNEAEVDKTALGVFLYTAATAVTLRPGLRSKVAGGMLFGLAALTRGNLLLVGFAAAAGLLLWGDGASAPADPGEAALPLPSPGVRRRGAAAFALAFAAALLPSTLRNYHFSGEFHPTTSGAGAVFYTGNNPANASGGFEHVPFVRSDPVFEEADFRAEAERRAGLPLSPGEISRFWLREGLRHVADHPAFAAEVTLRKAALLVTDYELPDAWDLYFLARYSVVLRLPILTLGGLAGLALLGLVIGWRLPGVRRVAALLALYACAMLPFFVFARYRMYMAPGLAVLGGVGLERLVRDGAGLSPVRVAAGLAAGAALAAFSFSGIGAPSKHEHSYSMVGLASLYAARGEDEPARRLLDEALRIDPGSAQTWCVLGELELRRGQAQQALQSLFRCTDLDPEFQGAWYWIGVAELRTGDRAAAERAFLIQLQVLPGHREATEALRKLGR